MAYTNPVENKTVNGEIIDSGTQAVNKGGVAVNGVIMAGALQQVNSGGLVSGTVGKGGNLKVLAGGSAKNVVMSGGVLSGDGVMDGVNLYDNAWTQVAGGTLTNISIFDKTRIELIGNNAASNITIDAAGVTTAVGKTRVGAQLIVFKNYIEGTPAATNVTLQNGGSAHIYDGGAISGCLIKNGGVLYLTDWDFDTKKDWKGNYRPQNGTVQSCTVEAGGTLYIGGSAATIQNATVKYGANIDGFRVSQKLIGVKVYVTATTYKNYTILGGGNNVANMVIDPNSPIKRLGGMGRGPAGNPTATQMSKLIINEGGILYDVSYYSKIDGKYVFNDGSSASFTMGSGNVTGYVLASGMNLYGDIQGTTICKVAPQLKNVQILDGGILDGFRTGRTGDGTNVSNGTYTDASGKTVNWSFGQGKVENLVINSGCFVVQGISSAGAVDGGVATNLTVNNGIVVFGNGASATGLKISSGTALQIYSNAEVSGVNTDTGAAFEVAGGSGTGLLIENGGFFNIGSGGAISDSEITGSRSHASGNSKVAQSMLAVNDGGSAKNVQLSNGSLLQLSGAFNLNNVKMDKSVTVQWLAFDPNCIIADTTLNGYENLNWNAETKTLTGWVHNGMGTSTFKPLSKSEVKYVDLTVADIPYNTAGWGSVDVDIDGLTFDLNPAVDGVASSSPTRWTNAWAGAWTVGAGSSVRNVKIYGGEFTGIKFNIDNLLLESRYTNYNCSMTTSGNTLNTVTVDKGIYYAGIWGDGGASVITDLTVKAGAVSLRNGSVRNLVGTGGKFQLYSKAEGSVAIYGNFTLKDTLVEYYGTQVKLDLDSLDSLTLQGGTTINNDISGGAGKFVTIYGVGNKIGAGFAVSVGTVIFDLAASADNWFNTGAVLADFANVQSEIKLNLRDSQGDYRFGTTAVKKMAMLIGGTAAEISFGETITVNGYEIKAFSDNGAGVISVRATASTNTDLGWADIAWSASKNYAVKYVNDLAASTSGTVNLGDAMENAGGNGVNNAFGTISTGGIVTAAQTGTTIFGGASNKDIATTWLKVTGGSKNVIYGGGNGKNITDGTNVYIKGDKTLTTALVFGGGKNATVSVGANNKYAVNMDVAGGRHRYVYGGGENCVINGDIAVWAYDTLVFSIFSGAGSSDVNGNINVNLDLPSYEGSKMSGNFYGGAVPVVGTTGTTGRNSNIVGNINMTLSSSADALGAYEGLIYGGSRAWGSVANVDGDINLKVTNIVHTDNLKLIAAGKGNSAWIVGGSQIVNNGATAGTGLITGTVNMTIGSNSLSNVVGGGQAQGAGATLTVNAVNMTISGATIANGVYGAGYAAQGGSVSVGSSLITISASATAATTIQGYVYAAGYVVGSGSVNVVNDSVVAFTGDGNYLTIGTVNGLGKGNCSVGGMTVAAFNNFTGEFSGTLVNFDAVAFGGNTTGLTMANAYNSSTWVFNVIGRTATDMFTSDPGSFNLRGDERAINLIIDTKAGFSFDLIDVTDETLEGVTVNLFDADKNSLGSFAFGGSLTVDKGTLTLENVDGVLSVDYKKGVLA
ncbi:MAG: hypothetical protein PHI85_08805 [Victivallaceae bacterium]|nr:hypothetical protein [Victivallaceae bacterium]